VKIDRWEPGVLGRQRRGDKVKKLLKKAKKSPKFSIFFFFFNCNFSVENLLQTIFETLFNIRLISISTTQTSISEIRDGYKIQNGAQNLKKIFAAKQPLCFEHICAFRLLY
jgi:hypothetical protein